MSQIRYEMNALDFFYITGAPIAYYVDKSFYEIFKKFKSLETFAEPRQGLTTCDNDRFLRFWHEVSFDKVGLGCSSLRQSEESQKKWFPYNKGGEPRKWYGNNEYVVNWFADGKEIKAFVAEKYVSYTRTVKNIPYYFRKGLTWSAIANKFAVRAYETGFIFADKGQAIFCNDENYYYLCGLLNSICVEKILEILSPTVDFNCGYIKKIPFVLLPKDNIDKIAQDNISLAQQDWDNFETSWDFKKHPLI